MSWVPKTSLVTPKAALDDQLPVSVVEIHGLQLAQDWLQPVMHNAVSPFRDCFCCIAANGNAITYASKEHDQLRASDIGECKQEAAIYTRTSWFQLRDLVKGQNTVTLAMALNRSGEPTKTQTNDNDGDTAGVWRSSVVGTNTWACNHL
jgi:hypothetical protein